MSFDTVNNHITDPINRIAEDAGSLPEIRALAFAYMQLAIRFNRQQLFFKEFFEKTSLSTTMDFEAFEKQLGPIDKEAE